MIRAIAIALVLLFTGSASAQTVQLPQCRRRQQRRRTWRFPASYTSPPAPGRLPRSCWPIPAAAFGPHTDVWGKLLASWGYVVVAPDSFGPRGEKSVCGRGNVVNGNMRVADVAGAIDFLNAQPFVRKGEIGLIGHSHGGWTTVRAVQKSYGLAARGLKAAVAYYPACQQRFDRDVAVPLLILIGDQDDWTRAEDCRKLQAAGFTQPSLVDVVYYPNAYHSFDSKVADRTITVADGKQHHLAYDPVAGPDAEARTKAFFEKYLR